MGTAEYGASGFFVLPRSSWRSKRDKLLFYDLVEQANYRDNKDIKRGQVPTSVLKLADETGWSEKQIRGSLDYLKKQGLITIETFKDKKKGIKITILDYEKTQDLSTYKHQKMVFNDFQKGELKDELKGEYEGELAASKKPVTPTVEDAQMHDKGELKDELKGEFEGDSLTTDITTDKHKKDSCPKRIKRVYDESSDPFKLALYLRRRILRWKPNAKVPDETVSGLASWADDMRKMMELDGRSKYDIQLVIQWATDDSFWQANILSAATLRRQYDKLEGQMRRKVVRLPQQEEAPRASPAKQNDLTDQAYAGFEKRAANDMAFQEMIFGTSSQKDDDM